MPTNRHMTWGDRQAEAAREKNLEKLRKLAESVPAPATDAPEVTTNVTKPAPAKSAAPPKKAAPAKAANKSAAKPSAKKSATTKAKKATKK